MPQTAGRPQMAQLLGQQILAALRRVRRCRRIETRRHLHGRRSILLDRRANTRREPSTARLIPQRSIGMRDRRMCPTPQPRTGIRLARRAPLALHRSAKARLIHGACPTSQPPTGVRLARKAPLALHRSLKMRLIHEACPTPQPRIERRLARRARSRSVYLTPKRPIGARLAGKAPPSRDRAKLVHPSAPVNSGSDRPCSTC